MANSVDPDQTASIGAVCSGSTLFASILNSSVKLGNYLQQTTSADDIFRCTLRVKGPMCLGEEHYNIISALHKSMRGSDDNAALYWLARMLEREKLLSLLLGDLLGPMCFR